MYKFYCSLLIIFTLSANAVNAQNWEFGLGINAMNFQGDVVAPALFTFKETQPSFGLLARRNFEGDKLGLRLGLNFGKLSGADANFTDPSWRQVRKYTFSTPLTELSAVLEYSPLSKMKDDGSKRGILPYLFAGFGLGFIDPIVSFNEASSIATGLKTQIAADKANAAKTILAFPIGAGFKFPMEKGTLALEMGFRPTTSDYLDGISKSANPNNNDWYVVGGLSYSFRFGGGSEPKKEVELKVVNITPQPEPEKDTDGDGVVDSMDKCPTVAGDRSNNGCPLEKDTDGDGIVDAKDKCPNEAGDKTNSGCPLDSDGDGIVDAQDKCPTVAGDKSNNGCPLEKDTDGDGIVDSKDKCPNEAGDKNNNGCPLEKDTDGDGIVDSKDKCPNVAGDRNNNGCPVMSTSDAAIIKEAIQNINFETNSSVFTANSLSILDKVADVLSRNTTYKLSIEGHTDSKGKEESNLALSKSRAAACVKYLAKKGVSVARMTSNGFGSSKPVDTNDTDAGRRRNRRVEFNLSN